MEPIKFVSTCIKENIDDVKLSLLFADKIEIPDLTYAWGPTQPKEGAVLELGKDVFIERLRVSEAFRDQISILQREGLVEIKDEMSTIKDDPLWKHLKSICEDIIQKHWKDVILTPLKDTAAHRARGCYVVDKEAENILKEFGKKDEFSFFLTYYEYTLALLLRETTNGNPTLSTSRIINDFLKIHYNTKIYDPSILEILKSFDLNPQIAFNVLKVNLPNISRLAVEDILELREKLADEFIGFKYEMEKLQFDLSQNHTSNFLNANARDIVKFKVQPAIDDLSHRLKTGNYKFLKPILAEIKDPKSYTPLLTTIFGGIPSHIAFLLSAGVVSVNSISEILSTMKERNQLKANGLNYVLKLKKNVSKGNQNISSNGVITRLLVQRRRF